MANIRVVAIATACRVSLHVWKVEADTCIAGLLSISVNISPLALQSVCNSSQVLGRFKVALVSYN